MNEYKILKDLIKFNTIKDNQNKEIINYIENYLLKLGFKTELKDKNLIISIGENPKVGFLGHTDTVEYIDGWKTNPFELMAKGNKLYGLGVCDMKSGIAGILDAIAQVDLNQLKNGFKLYFTYDEEIGFGGIYDIVNSNEIFPEVMIFGEPTNNEVIVGSKGLLEYELSFNGIKVHSGNPEKGKSANMNAVKFLMELNEFYQEKIRSFEDNNYEIPYTTMNVGIINGGSAINSVSSSCKVLMDFRIANKEHIDIIKKEMDLLAEKYDCKTNIIECKEPFINESELVSEIKTCNYITEASFIDTEVKIILGAGPVTAHEVDEYITVESYDKLVEQYKEIIYKYG